MEIAQFKHSQRSLSIKNDKTIKTSTATISKANNSDDTIAITPHSIELTKAVESVRSEVLNIYPHGYNTPPNFLTNAKQIEIIKGRIEEKLSNPSDKETQQAAESIWKVSGYRDDKEQAPSPFRGSGSVYDYLTKKDREDLGVLYDEALKQGLHVQGTVSKVATAMSGLRNDDAAISLGCKITQSQWPEIPAEYWDEVSSEENHNSSHNLKENIQFEKGIDLADFRAMESHNADSVLQLLLDNLTGTPREQSMKISLFDKITSLLSERFNEKSNDLFRTTFSQENSEDKVDTAPEVILPEHTEAAKQGEKSSSQLLSIDKRNISKYKTNGIIQSEAVFNSLLQNFSGSEKEKQQTKDLFDKISNSLLDGMPEKETPNVSYTA